jgi:hypothetical protein
MSRFYSARASWVFGLAAATVLLLSAPAAADVTNPERVSQLVAGKTVTDIMLSWEVVDTDVTGNPETIDQYFIYRGTTPTFVPDVVGFTNRVGISAAESFTDVGAAADGIDYYYLIGAVDLDGNRSNVRDSKVTTPPTLDGNWTPTTIDVTWTDAEPQAEVATYKVYWGRAAGELEGSVVAGLTNAHSLTGLLPNTAYYIYVTAVDLDGNESGFSNVHVDYLDGTVTLRANDESNLCPNTSNCPAKPGEVQRDGGQEIMVPVDFPPGNWVSATLTFTAESRLCDDPIAPDRCGDTNPGWNPCGDPWDRTASVFLVLDDCIESGGTCFGRDGNMELLRTITPFGTDAPVEEGGNGRVPPAVWEYDITPLSPMLTGTKYVGVNISTWVTLGWWVTVDFTLSENPANASDEPPADGIQQVFFHGGGNVTTPVPVTIPPEATQVFVRFFTTGHSAVALGPEDLPCPNGQPNGDEFCMRENSITANGLKVWRDFVWRTDCTPGAPLQCGTGTCSDWNSCGCPSCTFPRSGWCPGFIACHHNDPCDNDVDATLRMAPGGTYDVLFTAPNMTTGAWWAKSLVVYWYE